MDDGKIMIELNKNYSRNEVKQIVGNMRKKINRDQNRIYADSSDSSSSDDCTCVLTKQQAITQLQLNNTKLSVLKNNLSSMTVDEAVIELKAYLIEHIWIMQDYFRSIDKKQMVKIEHTSYHVNLGNSGYQIGVQIDRTKLGYSIDRAIYYNDYIILYYS